MLCLAESCGSTVDGPPTRRQNVDHSNEIGVCGVSLPERRAGGVGVERRHAQALGHADGGGGADARGPPRQDGGGVISPDSALVASGTRDRMTTRWTARSGFGIPLLTFTVA
jgi:hypothetical protein